ncbi:MAG: AAA family ATPase [Chloroflexi bacterium]|nr:AAA family ATPase [Chloroflexota bacterium]
MYKSFRVKNFRCFKDLQINDLGRVNLIAGQNNTGKTALLEAGLVLSAPLTPNLLLDLLDSRGLIIPDINRRDVWQQIFYGLDTTREINLSGVELENDEKSRRLSVNELNPMESNHEHFANYVQGCKRDGYFPDGYIDTRGASMLVYSFSYPDATPDSDHVYLASNPELPFFTKNYADKRYVYFPAEARRNPQDRADTFSALEGNGKLPKLIHYLDVFEPGLSDMRVRTLSGSSTIWGYVNSHQIPLRLMGTALNRFADIAMAFLVEKPQVIFIDEIENGIHHSVQSKVWKAIGQVARELDIQVFATTHSYEMIEAAHEAFKDDDPYEFRFHRLNRRSDDDYKDEIEAITYNKAGVEAFIRSHYEVRG